MSCEQTVYSLKMNFSIVFSNKLSKSIEGSSQEPKDKMYMQYSISFSVKYDETGRQTVLQLMR